MCGIIGCLNQNQMIDVENFTQMRDELFHRGPDGFGTEIFENNKCAFGHRRLSIIDLSEKAKQPMYSFDKSVLLTFNGEIYNYKTLRKELIESGFQFKSTSDTEVLINGYTYWGINGLLKKIKGMYAFALWDDNIKKVYVVRDRFGMKPLYYQKTDHHFLFASEAKAIVKSNNFVKKINKNAIADYFIYSYIPGETSIWEGVRKLLPGHYLIFDFKENTLDTHEYWKLKVDSKQVSTEEAFQKSSQLLKNAVNEHLVSDVNVGVFLSAGYDSTSVLNYAAEYENSINTFSLGFEESKRSEHHVSKKIANHFKTNHKELVLKPSEKFYEELKKLSWFYDEPFAISSMLNYYLISKEASKFNKVVLVGDGGDEAFGGYRWYGKIRDF